MILMIGGQELLIVAVVLLVLFGAKKIPSLMKDVGKGVSELNKVKDEIKNELKIDDIGIIKDMKKIKETIKK
jgi:sec-independent protein translocase protein TatA